MTSSDIITWASVELSSSLARLTMLPSVGNLAPLLLKQVIALKKVKQELFTKKKSGETERKGLLKT